MGIPEMITAAKQIGSHAFNVGYDQSQRWSFFDRETLQLIPNRETDCSAASGAVARLGGYKVDLSDPFYTGNFESRMVSAGFQSISVVNWGKTRLFNAVKAGDFLLGPGHVIFVIAPNQWLSAQNDEYGRSSGGRAGDQTKSEVMIRAPYMRSRGWTQILRPTTSGQQVSAVKPTPATNTAVPPFPLPQGWWFGPKEGPKECVSGWYNTQKDGTKGHDGLALWQQRMIDRGWKSLGVADGLYGEATAKVAKAFQAEKGLKVDGDIGPATWAAAWTAPGAIS